MLVQDFDFVNETVENNFHINPQLQSFKKIIKKVGYPFPGDLSELSIAYDAIQAYKDMGGTHEGIVELMVFASECAINYLSDTYDMEEESYKAGETLFEKTFAMVMASPENLIAQHKPRLRELVTVAQGGAYGGSQLIHDLWLKTCGEDIPFITINEEEIFGDLNSMVNGDIDNTCNIGNPCKS